MERPSAASSGANPNELSVNPVARLGGHILVDCLATQGVTHAFGVPGESFLAVLDGFYQHRKQMQFVVCRHEGGAANMAEAHGKMSGKPGICFVTRGPGATNASIGVHTAFQDSTPMILFIGQVGSDFADREAFQEIDYRRMFGQMAKWVAQIDRTDRIPEYIARAFQVAQSGRPGPVVLALPEDMLTRVATVANTIAAVPMQASPSRAQLDQLHTLIQSAKRPLVIAGGPGWDQQACADLASFAKNNRLPIACAFRFQDLCDHHQDHYVGDVGIALNPRLAARVRESDLIIALGPRLGEMTTSGYSLLAMPVPHQTLVHIHADTDELGTVYQAQLMIAAGAKAMASALATMSFNSDAWARWSASARADYVEWQQEPAFLQTGSYTLNPWHVMQDCAQILPRNTIVTNGAGNFATWGHRFWRYAGLRTQLAPTSGAMGYGIPAGIAAKIVEPNRTVLTLAGDGDFQMTSQELATASQYGAGVIVLVFNNGMYGTIRMHQEREYPGRVSGTDMFDPDFAMLGQAYGGYGKLVTRTEDFAATLNEALIFTREKNRPAVIELKMDPQILTTGMTLEQFKRAKT